MNINTILGIIIAIIIIIALLLLISVALKANKSKIEINPVSPEEMESAQPEETPLNKEEKPK